MSYLVRHEPDLAAVTRIPGANGNGDPSGLVIARGQFNAKMLEDLAVQHGGHIAVEWLLGKLGRTGTRVVLLAGHALVIAAYILLLWQALAVADIVSVERSPALGLPKTYGYWAVAAGCALLALSTLTVAIRLAVIGPEAMPRPKPEEIPT